ncbi:MAG: O-antigen ligase family protein [Chloroflexota bacterium]|nr:O-antigen ligase family protein [Chloroflexota bacterium]
MTLGVSISLICALIASYSRGAWIGSIAAFVVMLFFLPYRPIIGVGSVIVTIALGAMVVYLGLVPDHLENRITSILEYVSVQDVRRVSIDAANFSVVERAAHWQAASKMVEAHPWLGVGMGNYQVVYPEYRLVSWKSPLGHAHNVYLNVAAETGFIGLSSYILFWGYVFLKTIRVLRRSTNWNRGIALGLLGAWTHLGVHNFVDNLFVNNTHLCLGGLLGVLSVVNTRVGNKS